MPTPMQVKRGNVIEVGSVCASPHVPACPKGNKMTCTQHVDPKEFIPVCLCPPPEVGFPLRRAWTCLDVPAFGRVPSPRRVWLRLRVRWVFGLLHSAGLTRPRSERTRIGLPERNRV